jgi:hypothetical protein
MKTKTPKENFENFMGSRGCVFNCHVNDADKRARETLAISYPTFLEEVEKIEEEENGIMGIFHREPTQATMAYTILVTAFVCEI